MLKSTELMNMSEQELIGMFKGYSKTQLEEFLKENNIPFRKSFSKKKLFEHTINEIIQFGIFYRIGHS